MERLFASDEPLASDQHTILLCSDRVETPVAERILPDGAVHLIFNLGDRQAGDRGADLDCLVMGATCTPTRIVLTGRLEQVCVRLSCGSAAAVLGVPAGEVTDRGVDLSAVWGAAAAEMRQRLAEAPRGPRRTAVMVTALRERMRRADPGAKVAAAAVRRIVARAGAIRVGELAAGLGIGERRLQQLFHEHIGLSPKAACRLARFRAVLAARRRVRGSWLDVALEGGLYDQSHLVHELKAFTGLTPGELARAGFGFLQDAAPAAG